MQLALCVCANVFHWSNVPAVPCDAPSCACSAEERQPAGPEGAAGDVAAALAWGLGLGLAWTVMVLVAAAPGAGVLPQAVSSAQAPASAAAPDSRAVRVNQEVMKPISLGQGGSSDGQQSDFQLRRRPGSVGWHVLSERPW